jgi:hypothetical protein
MRKLPSVPEIKQSRSESSKAATCANSLTATFPSPRGSTETTQMVPVRPPQITDVFAPVERPVSWFSLSWFGWKDSDFSDPSRATSISDSPQPSSPMSAPSLSSPSSPPAEHNADDLDATAPLTYGRHSSFHPVLSTSSSDSDGVSIRRLTMCSRPRVLPIAAPDRFRTNSNASSALRNDSQFSYESASDTSLVIEHAFATFSKSEKAEKAESDKRPSERASCDSSVMHVAISPLNSTVECTKDSSEDQEGDKPESAFDAVERDPLSRLESLSSTYGSIFGSPSEM